MAAEASDAALLLKFSDEHLHAVDEDDGPCGHFLPPPTTATRVKSEAQRVKAEEARGGGAPWRQALEALEGLRVTLAAARAVEPEPRVVEEAALERRGAATVTKGDMLTQAKATQRAMALNLMFEELARESLGETESGEVLERAAFCPLSGFVAAAGLEPPFVATRRSAAAGAAATPPTAATSAPTTRRRPRPSTRQAAHGPLARGRAEPRRRPRSVAIEVVAEAVGRSAGEMTDCLARALAAKYELVNDAGPFAHWDRVTDEMRCDHEMVLSRGRAHAMCVEASNGAKYALERRQAVEGRLFEHRRAHRRAERLRNNFFELRDVCQKAVVPDIRKLQAEYEHIYEDLTRRHMGDLDDVTETFAQLRSNGCSDDGGRPPCQYVADNEDRDSLPYLKRVLTDSVHATKLMLGPAVTKLREDVVASLGLRPDELSVDVGPPKHLDRAVEKAAEDYERDYSRLIDLSRASIVCGASSDVPAGDAPAGPRAPATVSSIAVLVEVVRAVARLHESHEMRVLRFKNRFAIRCDPPGGYRDIQLVVKFRGLKHLCELQVHLRDFKDLKDHGGHATYDMTRQMHMFDKEFTSASDRWAPEVPGLRERVDTICRRIEMGALSQLTLDYSTLDEMMAQQLAIALTSDSCQLSVLSLRNCQVSDGVVASVVGSGGAVLRDVRLGSEDFVNGEFGDDGVHAITSSCAELHKLDLDRCRTSPRALRALGGLRSLRVLSLRDCAFAQPNLGLDDGVVDALTACPFSRSSTRDRRAPIRLEALRLGATGADARNAALSVAGVSRLVRRYKSLLELDLTWCAVEPRALRELAKARSLASLDLSGTLDAACDGATRLRYAGDLGSLLNHGHALTSLSLRHCPLGVDGAQAVATALKNNRTLLDLDLADAGLGDDAIARLSEGLARNKTLGGLGLDGNRFETCASLARSGSLARLSLRRDLRGDVGVRAEQRLALCDKQLSSQDYAVVSRLLEANKKLTALDVSGNDTGASWADDVRSLFDDAAVVRTLQTVKVHAHTLDVKKICGGEHVEYARAGLARIDAFAVAALLRHNTHIRVVDLCHNGVQSDAIVDLCDALRGKTSLSSLLVAGNNFAPAEARAALRAMQLLCGVLCTHDRLRSLALKGAELTEAGVRDLVVALGRNRTLETLDLRESLAPPASSEAHAEKSFPDLDDGDRVALKWRSLDRTWYALALDLGAALEGHERMDACHIFPLWTVRKEELGGRSSALAKALAADRPPILVNLVALDVRGLGPNADVWLDGGGEKRAGANDVLFDVVESHAAKLETFSLVSGEAWRAAKLHTVISAPKLRYLELRHCGLTAQVAHMLFTSLKVLETSGKAAPLEVVSLDENDLDDSVLASTKPPAIGDIVDVDIVPEELDALRAALKLDSAAAFEDAVLDALCGPAAVHGLPPNVRVWVEDDVMTAVASDLGFENLRDAEDDPASGPAKHARGGGLKRQESRKWQGAALPTTPQPDDRVAPSVCVAGLLLTYDRGDAGDRAVLVAQGPKDEADGFERAKGLGSAKAEAWTVPLRRGLALADPADVLRWASARLRATHFDCRVVERVFGDEDHGFQLVVVATPPHDDPERDGWVRACGTAIDGALSDAPWAGGAAAGGERRPAALLRGLRLVGFAAHEFSEGHGGEVTSVAVSGDGNWVATGSCDKTARVWDADSGACLATLTGHGSFVRGVAFSPDGTRVATASQDHTARVWDAATGSLLRTLEGHELSVNAVAFSPDGHRLATASRDKTALVWDLRDDDAPPVVLEGHDSCVNGIAFAPDGSRVATASNDKRCIVWDASTGEELESLEGHENWVEGCAFSPDGRRVATASQDHHARVWEGGVCVMTLAGHGKRVNDVAFAGDGATLVTASDDETAKSWDLATGACLETMHHRSEVNACAFGRGGTLVATACNDRTAKLWDAATAARTRTLNGCVRTAVAEDACFCVGDVVDWDEGRLEGRVAGRRSGGAYRVARGDGEVDVAGAALRLVAPISCERVAGRLEEVLGDAYAWRVARVDGDGAAAVAALPVAVARPSRRGTVVGVRAGKLHGKPKFDVSYDDGSFEAAVPAARVRLEDDAAEGSPRPGPFVAPRAAGKAMAAIGAWLGDCATVRALSLRDVNLWTVRGPLCEGLARARRLETLDIAGNPCCDERVAGPGSAALQAPALAGAVADSALAHLRLGARLIDTRSLLRDASIDLTSDATCFAPLERAGARDKGANFPTCAVVAALASRNDALERLTARGLFRDDGDTFAAFLGHLRPARRLRHLDLSGNGLGVAGATRLREWLFAAVAHGSRALESLLRDDDLVPRAVEQVLLGGPRGKPPRSPRLDAFSLPEPHHRSPRGVARGSLREASPAAPGSHHGPLAPPPTDAPRKATADWRRRARVCARVAQHPAAAARGAWYWREADASKVGDHRARHPTTFREPDLVPYSREDTAALEAARGRGTFLALKTRRVDLLLMEELDTTLLTKKAVARVAEAAPDAAALPGDVEATGLPRLELDPDEIVEVEELAASLHVVAHDSGDARGPLEAARLDVSRNGIVQEHKPGASLRRNADLDVKPSGAPGSFAHVLASWIAERRTPVVALEREARGYRERRVLEPGDAVDVRRSDADYGSGEEGLARSASLDSLGDDARAAPARLAQGWVKARLGGDSYAVFMEASDDDVYYGTREDGAKELEGVFDRADIFAAFDEPHVADEAVRDEYAAAWASGLAALAAHDGAAAEACRLGLAADRRVALASPRKRAAPRSGGELEPAAEETREEDWRVDALDGVLEACRGAFRSALAASPEALVVDYWRADGRDASPSDRIAKVAAVLQRQLLLESQPSLDRGPVLELESVARVDPDPRVARGFARALSRCRNRHRPDAAKTEETRRTPQQDAVLRTLEARKTGLAGASLAEGWDDGVTVFHGGEPSKLRAVMDDGFRDARSRPYEASLPPGRLKLSLRRCAVVGDGAARLEDVAVSLTSSMNAGTDDAAPEDAGGRDDDASRTRRPCAPDGLQVNPVDGAAILPFCVDVPLELASGGEVDDVDQGEGQGATTPASANTGEATFAETIDADDVCGGVVVYVDGLGRVKAQVAGVVVGGRDADEEVKTTFRVDGDRRTNEDEWWHVAVVFDGDDARCKIYMNGDLDGSNSPHLAVPRSAPTPARRTAWATRSCEVGHEVASGVPGLRDADASVADLEALGVSCTTGGASFEVVAGVAAVGRPSARGAADMFDGERASGLDDAPLDFGHDAVYALVRPVSEVRGTVERLLPVKRERVRRERVAEVTLKGKQPGLRKGDSRHFLVNKPVVATSTTMHTHFEPVTEPDVFHTWVSAHDATRGDLFAAADELVLRDAAAFLPTYILRVRPRNQQDSVDEGRQAAIVDEEHADVVDDGDDVATLLAKQAPVQARVDAFVAAKVGAHGGAADPRAWRPFPLRRRLAREADGLFADAYALHRDVDVRLDDGERVGAVDAFLARSAGDVVPAGALAAVDLLCLGHGGGDKTKFTVALARVAPGHGDHPALGAVRELTVAQSSAENVLRRLASRPQAAWTEPQQAWLGLVRSLVDRRHDNHADAAHRLAAFLEAGAADVDAATRDFAARAAAVAGAAAALRARAASPTCSRPAASDWAGLCDGGGNTLVHIVAGTCGALRDAWGGASPRRSEPVSRLHAALKAVGASLDGAVGAWERSRRTPRPRRREAQQLCGAAFASRGAAVGRGDFGHLVNEHDETAAEAIEQSGLLELAGHDEVHEAHRGSMVDGEPGARPPSTLHIPTNLHHLGAAPRLPPHVRLHHARKAYHLAGRRAAHRAANALSRAPYASRSGLALLAAGGRSACLLHGARFDAAVARRVPRWQRGFPDGDEARADHDYASWTGAVQHATSLSALLERCEGHRPSFEAAVDCLAAATNARAAKRAPLKERLSCVEKMTRQAKTLGDPRRILARTHESSVKHLTDVLRATLAYDTVGACADALEAILDPEAWRSPADWPGAAPSPLGDRVKVVAAKHGFLESSGGYRHATVILRLGGDRRLKEFGEANVKDFVVAELQLTTARQLEDVARYRAAQESDIPNFKGSFLGRAVPRGVRGAPRRHAPVPRGDALRCALGELAPGALLDELCAGLAARRPKVGASVVVGGATRTVAASAGPGVLADDTGDEFEAGAVVAVDGAPVGECFAADPDPASLEARWGGRGLAFAIGEDVEARGAPGVVASLSYEDGTYEVASKGNVACATRTCGGPSGPQVPRRRDGDDLAATYGGGGLRRRASPGGVRFEAHGDDAPRLQVLKVAAGLLADFDAEDLGELAAADADRLLRAALELGRAFLATEAHRPPRGGVPGRLLAGLCGCALHNDLGEARRSWAEATDDAAVASRLGALLEHGRGGPSSTTGSPLGSGPSR
ncbi:hypothetical protein JL721_12990 [Aureococcus anophagefferens]|nr:hypothetical protein JL721_12990 [Aureococcus anophagefferens]